MEDHRRTKEELIAELIELRRKLTEVEEAHSEKGYRNLIESTGDLIYTTDSKGYLTYVNPILARVLGYASSELVGKAFLKIVAPEYADKVKHMFKEAMKGKFIPVYDAEIRTKDGRRVSVEFNVTTLKNAEGKPSGRYGIGRDVTDRKKMELALRKSETEKAVILEGILDLVFYVDKDLKVIYSNNAMEAFFHLPAGSLPGKYCYRELHKRNEPCQVCPARRAMDTGRHQEALISSYGRHWRLRGYPVRDDNGEIVGAIEAVSDITDMKNAEEKFRSIFENAVEGIFQTTPEGRFLSVNPAFARIFGYGSPESMMNEVTDIGEQIYVDPADRCEYVRRLNEQEMVRNYVFQGLRRDGTKLHASVNARAIRDGKGKVLYFEGMLEDITERKQAETALREAHRQLDEIIEFLPDATLVVDADGKAVAWNRAMEQMTGVPKREMIGKGNYEYALPFYGERVPILVDLALLPDSEFEKNRYDSIQRSADTIYGEIHVPKIYGGKGAYLSGSASRLRNTAGSIIGAIESIRDITERKRMEDILQESEGRLRAIFESVKDFIFIKDRDRRYTLVNNFFRKRFDVDPSVFIGRTDAEIPIFENRTETGETIRDTDSLVMQGETLEYQITHRILGNWLTFDIIKTPIRDENGNVVSICGVSRDVTDRRRDEEERKALEQRLQRAEKMEALGTLAGGVAHDLNNVLGVVVGYSELLLMEMDKSNPVRSTVASIMQGGQRAAAIVQDLLTLARRGVPSRKVINLNRVINEYQQSAEFLKLSSSFTSVKVRTDLEPDLLNVSGSSVHLGKTLFNLVANAVEAMPDGGILTIRTANQYLDKPIQGYDEIREGDYVVLSISDTGEGIKKADMKRIFEPFYTKKIMGRSGTGLGLAVVWGTVKDHNGYINVQSEEGKGSTFTLYFPVTREAVSGDRASPSVEDYKGSGESILVVDDIKGQRELAEEMLRKLNYRVESVSSGEDAVTYLKDNKADLVVLDMIMDPGMDGLNTYKKILRIRPGQKAIIVSGFSETDRVSRAQELGAGTYIKKPYVLEKLGLAVKKELGAAVKSES